MYTAAEVNTIETILPEENTLILKNGRKVEYDWLVLAMGLKEDFNAIKGFEDAWSDPEHPFFTCKVIIRKRILILI
jgi:NADH dehydrogenase FAD-containing subunit